MLRIEIDEPQDKCLKEPTGCIRGWFAARDTDLPETFHFEIGGTPVAHSAIKREDVEGAMPGHAIAGFLIPYDLSFYLPNIDEQGLAIRLILPEYSAKTLRFKIAESALGACLAAASDF
jgi:hypothetical protein